MRRTVLALAFVLFAATPSLAHVSLPLCGEQEALGATLLLPPFHNQVQGYTPGCALRVLVYPAPASGVRFVHRRNATIIEERTQLTATFQHQVPETQHACDGSRSLTERPGPLEYDQVFEAAQLGDAIDVYANGVLVNTASIVEQGCPTLDWAPSDCALEVCEDDDHDNDNNNDHDGHAGGCSTTNYGSLFLGFIFAAVFLARRRICACRA